MFINLSNHDHRTWSAEQLAAAKEYGEICDLRFPDVPAAADEAWITETAAALCRNILEKKPAAVLVQGEMALTYAVVACLLENGVTAVCAASERRCETVVAPDGSSERHSVFRFVRFRKYSNLT